MDTRRSRGQAGQVVPVMAAVIVLVAALGVGVADLGARVVQRARAQNAADAAALAVAVTPVQTASRSMATVAAERNGARVVDVDRDGPIVIVSIDYHHIRATAAARPVAAPAGEVP